MDCQACGQPVEVDSKFCRHCGAAQVSATVAEPQAAASPPLISPSASQSSRTPIVVAICVLAGLGGVAWYAAPPLERAKPIPPVQEAPPSTDWDRERLAKEAAALKAKLEAGNTADGNPAPTPPASDWTYSESRDDMRGTVTKYAVVTSENAIDLGFPYGTVYARVTIRKRPSDGMNIMFSVDQGQILCHSYSDSYLTAKFDNGRVQSFSCTGAADGTSDVAFIEAKSSFLVKLRKAERLIIEAPFYQAGNKQFTFETKGLEWK